MVVSFEQQDNLFFFNATLDNASFEISVVPLPAAAWMGLTLLGGLSVAGAVRRRRRVA